MIKFIIVIDEYLFDERLNSSEKLIMGVIYSLSYKNGYCYPTNDYLSKVIRISDRSVRRILSKLKSMGLIEIKNINGMRNIVPIIRTSNSYQTDIDVLLEMT